MSCYIVQEIDGTSRFTLEDGSGFLVLEDCIPAPPGDIVIGGLPIRRSRRRNREQIGDEEAVISLTLSELL